MITRGEDLFPPLTFFAYLSDWRRLIKPMSIIRSSSPIYYEYKKVIFGNSYKSNEQYRARHYRLDNPLICAIKADTIFIGDYNAYRLLFLRETMV